MRLAHVLLETRNVINVKPNRANLGSIQEIVTDLARFPQPDVARWTTTVLRNYLIRDYTGGATRDITDDLVSRPDVVAMFEPWVAQALQRGDRLFVVEPDDAFLREVRQVQDYLRDLVAQGGANLSRISVPAAIQQSRQWHAEAAKRGVGAADDAGGVVPVMNFHDGYQWIELKSGEALKFEGGQMQHCVGSFAYAQGVASGQTRIFSLRDPQGKPHVTIEADSHIRQVKGKQNTVPVAKYLPYTLSLLNALKLPPAGEDTEKLGLIFHTNRYGGVADVAEAIETVPGGNWYHWEMVEPATEEEPGYTRRFYALLDATNTLRLKIQTSGRFASTVLDTGFDFRPYAESVIRYLNGHRVSPERLYAINREDGGIGANDALRTADIVTAPRESGQNDLDACRWIDISGEFGPPEPLGDSGYAVSDFRMGATVHRRLITAAGQPVLTLRIRQNTIFDTLAHAALRGLGEAEVGHLTEAINHLGVESGYNELHAATGLDLWYDETTERFGTFADISKPSMKFTNGHAIRYVTDSEKYSRIYRLLDPAGRPVVQVNQEGGEVQDLWPVSDGRRGDDDALPTAEQCSMIATWMAKKNFHSNTAKLWMVRNFQTSQMAVRVTGTDEPQEVVQTIHTLADFLRTRWLVHLDAGFCRRLVAALSRHGHAFVDGDEMIHAEDPQDNHFIRTVRVEVVQD